MTLCKEIEDKLSGVALVYTLKEQADLYGVSLRTMSNWHANVGGIQIKYADVISDVYIDNERYIKILRGSL